MPRRAVTASPSCATCAGVRRRRGSFELRVDELQLAAGEAVAVVGPSGTGKSTLLGLLAGLDAPDEGEVGFAGTLWSTLAPSARRTRRLERIGQVPQGFELVPHLDVIDNVRLPALVGARGVADREVRARARELLDAVDLGPLERRWPAELSEGQRQRVAVCRALVLGPTLILADEPAASLDPQAAARVHDVLFAEVRERGATLVLVTHDGAVLSRFDRVFRTEPADGADSCWSLVPAPAALGAGC